MKALRVPALVMTILGCGMLLSALPVSADWLVTTSGAAIETKGSWEVKGKLIVFQNADGKLASLRASKVDLNASEALTAERLRAAQAPPPAPPAPLYDGPQMVLTDDDVATYVPPPSTDGEDDAAATSAAAGEEGVGAAQAATPPTTNRGDLTVSAWQMDERYDGPGIRLLGTLVNNTPEVAASITLNVTAYDTDGSELGTALAVLSATTLPPGERTRFRAEFTTLANFTSIRFRPSAAQSFATTNPTANSNEEEAVP